MSSVDGVSVKTHKILINLSYLAHEYFAVSLNFSKMWNRFQYYETPCMKDVSNAHQLQTRNWFNQMYFKKNGSTLAYKEP